MSHQIEADQTPDDPLAEITLSYSDPQDITGIWGEGEHLNALIDLLEALKKVDGVNGIGMIEIGDQEHPDDKENNKFELRVVFQDKEAMKQHMDLTSHVGQSLDEFEKHWPFDVTTYSANKEDWTSFVNRGSTLKTCTFEPIVYIKLQREVAPLGAPVQL